MSIKINVGGTIFETTITTLKKINYFKYMLEDTNHDNTQNIFVDRPSHIFKHVLALAIDNNYNYPLKYKGELDFYDVSYNIHKLYEPYDGLSNDNRIIKEKIYDIYYGLNDIKDEINTLKNEINALKNDMDKLNNQTIQICEYDNCKSQCVNANTDYCEDHFNKCWHKLNDDDYNICGRYTYADIYGHYCQEHR